VLVDVDDAERLVDVREEAEEILMEDAAAGQELVDGAPGGRPAGKIVAVDLGTRTIATCGEFSVVERDGKKFFEQRVKFFCFLFFFCVDSEQLFELGV